MLTVAGFENSNKEGCLNSQNYFVSR